MSTLARVGAVTLLALSLAPPASAQVGIKGGINLTRFVGSDADAYESTPGLDLGASLSLATLGPIQLLGEVYYRQKGAELDPADPAALQELAEGGSYEIGLDYVEIPLLARLDLGGPGSRIRPYLVGGPAFGWRVSCGVSLSGAEAGAAEPECDDLTENFGSTVRSYEAGAVAGGGLEFSLAGLGGVSLDARYTRGLSKIGEGGDALNIRNQSFTVMLGYFFGMGVGGMGPGG